VFCYYRTFGIKEGDTDIAIKKKLLTTGLQLRPEVTNGIIGVEIDDYGNFTKEPLA